MMLCVSPTFEISGPLYFPCCLGLINHKLGVGWAHHMVSAPYYSTSAHVPYDICERGVSLCVESWPVLKSTDSDIDYCSESADNIFAIFATNSGILDSSVDDIFYSMLVCSISSIDIRHVGYNIKISISKADKS